ncbi:hypothetical protein [Candidatus Magnetobacterium casense]|uniref:Transposase n=1 Tax=Candidatus Magnetobacterium casense TaxID=1455061 RepID=A0ABS6S2R0_9BACT|nr:hypothetical protein [Candidatus Magnetobacterium casensis]MBV6343124.1 hypothetical protein [Candidatus Magnetobacterium casensis]
MTETHLGMDICINGAEHTIVTLVTLRNGVATVDQSWSINPQTGASATLKKKESRD